MKLRWLLCCAVVSLLLAAPLSAQEQMIADMDTATSSTTYYGSGSVGVGDAWADGQYDPGIYLGPTGRSFHLQWGLVNAVNEYAGGGIYFNTNATPRDISAYNNVSFIIFTPSTTMKAEVQLKDNAANVGKVKLSDYVTTVASTWQEVVIPLAAFKRHNPALDLTQASIIQLVADYTNGLEYSPSGSIRVDNLQVSQQTHAPSNSLIYSGSDKGTVNAADTAGDTLLWWDQAVSSATSNEVTVRVSPGYAIVFISTPTATHNVTPGATGYYAYQLRNDGNRADRVVFSTETLSGTWPSRVYWDKDKSGTFTAGDAECYDTFGLLPDSTHYFLLAIACPANAANGSSSKIRLVARDTFGSGANDTWPTAANDDTLTGDITDTAQAANISLAKSTSTATGKPGATVTYTLNITNSGGAAATNLVLVDVIPANMELQGAGAVSGGVGGAISYYVGSAWQAGWAANATKVRWTWTSVASGGGTAQGSFPAKIK